jgi:predicted phosphodiesterase
MRYAILSDIHANLDALRGVLAAVDRAEVDRLVCLGDLVGYYTAPNQCIELLRSRGVECIRGNHDAAAAGLREPTDFSAVARRAILWTQCELAEEHRAYLADLPSFRCVDDAFVIVHASLHPLPNDEQRIHCPADAILSLRILANRHFGTNVCFFGHTHHQEAYVLRNHHVIRIEGDHFTLSPEEFYMINPGSVGQPRDGDPRASVAIYDTLRQAVEFERVAYDDSASRQNAMAAGLLDRPSLLRRYAHRARARLRCLLPSSG